ncbi:MAG: hypothetical protein WDW38_002670 [Sanguina aurantia]
MHNKNIAAAAVAVTGLLLRRILRGISKPKRAKAASSAPEALANVDSKALAEENAALRSLTGRLEGELEEIKTVRARSLVNDGAELQSLTVHVRCVQQRSFRHTRPSTLQPRRDVQSVSGGAFPLTGSGHKPMCVTAQFWLGDSHAFPRFKSALRVSAQARSTYSETDLSTKDDTGSVDGTGVADAGRRRMTVLSKIMRYAASALATVPQSSQSVTPLGSKRGSEDGGGGGAQAIASSDILEMLDAFGGGSGGGAPGLSHQLHSLPTRRTCGE